MQFGSRSTHVFLKHVRQQRALVRVRLRVRVRVRVRARVRVKG